MNFSLKHRLLFLQEEQIEPPSTNTTFQSDSSWKVPANSHILMRASQVSSEFKQGDQSYLRLSLGQFFEQRSEALGCLGSSDDIDGVKRVSTSVLLAWYWNLKCTFSLSLSFGDFMLSLLKSSLTHIAIGGTCYGIKLRLHSSVPLYLVFKDLRGNCNIY